VYGLEAPDPHGEEDREQQDAPHVVQRDDDPEDRVDDGDVPARLLPSQQPHEDETEIQDRDDEHHEAAAALGRRHLIASSPTARPLHDPWLDPMAGSVFHPAAALASRRDEAAPGLHYHG
jgi:hypothetical protein